MKMKYYQIVIAVINLFMLPYLVDGQVYISKDAEISFYSYTPIEEIKAVNDKGVSVLSFDDSKVEFSVLIKGFHFKNALMQTHFNENYMDSDNYPKAVFKSTEANLSSVNIDVDGEYTVPVKGVLTVRGVDKEIETEGTIHVNGGTVSAMANFVVSPADFKIEIPSLVEGKIAKEIEVSVNSVYQLYDKS